MKKKNHLKKLALLGITSGLMMASPGQAETSMQVENQLASNYNYNYSGNYIRRGNYAYSKDRGESAESSQDSSFSEVGGSAGCAGRSTPQYFSSCASNAQGCGGQSPSQPSLQSSGCGGSNGCGGQQPRP